MWLRTRAHTHPLNSNRRSINWDVQHKNSSKNHNLGLGWGWRGGKKKTKRKTKSWAALRLWSASVGSTETRRHAQSLRVREGSGPAHDWTWESWWRQEHTATCIPLIIAAIRRCQYQPPTLNYCASHKYSPHALSLDSGRQTYNKNKW